MSGFRASRGKHLYSCEKSGRCLVNTQIKLTHQKNGGLPLGADAVLEDGGAILVDGDAKSCGPGGGLGEFVGGGEHLPIAADGFVDLDGDGRVLGVAQAALEFPFPEMRVDALVICLLAIGDDVEGVAEMHG